MIIKIGKLNKNRCYFMITWKRSYKMISKVLKFLWCYVLKNMNVPLPPFCEFVEIFQIVWENNNHSSESKSDFHYWKSEPVPIQTFRIEDSQYLGLSVSHYFC